MLNIVLADSELELIPSEIQEHPVIKKSSKKRGKEPSKILLDSNFHHKAMKNLDQNERRGRPDIIHISLLSALESILNKKNKLNIYIHTRDDKIIEVDPETRLPRSYNRFLGLIEKLFQVGSVPQDLELLKIEDLKLKNLLNDLSGKKFVMSEKGERVNKMEKKFEPKNNTVVIGGFPKGKYRSNPQGEKISIYEEELTSWTVMNEIITSYERS